MRSPICIVVLLLVFAALSKQLWITTTVEEVQWLSDCQLNISCAHPMLHLKLHSTVGNETISKTVKVNFSEPQIKNKSLSVHWNEGTLETIDLIVEGIDPIYGFWKICDSISYSIPSKIYGNDSITAMKNTTRASGNCFKAQITYEKYTECCPWYTMDTPDQQQNINSESSVTVTGIMAFACSVTCLTLIGIIKYVNCMMQVGSEVSEIKSCSASVTSNPVVTSPIFCAKYFQRDGTDAQLS